MSSYRLLRHPRARRLKLRVERDGALVVTAPKRVRQGEIDRFVRAQEAWIAAVRERLSEARADRDPAAFGLRPDRIELPAVPERWSVIYGQRERKDRSSIVHLPDGASDPDVVQYLQGWLKRRARDVLTPRVEQLAVVHGFEYRRLSIRNQRSRWGSCSSNGSLSLNAKLLFCSPAACRYVLIHELVHLEHPNHSPRFWRRVGEICPDYRQHMRELKIVWNRLPDWVTAT